MTNHRPTQQSGGWDIGINELEVTSIVLDNNIVVNFGSQDEVSLRIEGTVFVIDTESNREVRIDYDPYSSSPPTPTGIDWLGKLVHSRIISGQVDDQGRLRIQAANGLVLSVLPEQQYESWTLRGDTILVSTPGGELAFWEAE